MQGTTNYKNSFPSGPFCLTTNSLPALISERVVYKMHTVHIHTSWDESGTEPGSMFLSAAICITSLSVFCINLSRNPHLSRNWAIVIYTIVLLNVYFGLPHFKYGFNDHSDFTQKGGVRTFGHYGRGLNYARLWLFFYSRCQRASFVDGFFFSRGVLCISRSNTSLKFSELMIWAFRFSEFINNHQYLQHLYSRN